MSTDARSSEGVAPRAAAQDARVVAELYRRHVAQSFRLALRYGGGDRDWAQDVVHDVFIEVQRHAARLSEMDNPGGWIYRATTSRCLNRLQRDRFLSSPMVRWAVGRHEPATSTPEVLGAARQQLGRLFAAVNELPPKQRVCFWMYHVDGKTQDEIGEVLGCRKSYVSKLLSRAEAALRHIREEAEHG
jgi:RNA polymerase sigma-70 factor (ECF subfamily)